MENVWRMSGESSFVMVGKGIQKVGESLEKVWRMLLQELSHILSTL